MQNFAKTAINKKRLQNIHKIQEKTNKHIILMQLFSAAVIITIEKL
jgi:hypothetical protein